jgi:hypothetical protein
MGVRVLSTGRKGETEVYQVVHVVRQVTPTSISRGVRL